MRDCDVAWLPNKALSYLRVDLVWSGSGFGLPRGYGYLSRGQEPLSTLTSGPGTSTVSCASSQRTLNLGCFSSPRISTIFPRRYGWPSFSDGALIVSPGLAAILLYLL